MNFKPGEKIKLSYRARGGDKDCSVKTVVKKYTVIKEYENYILVTNGSYRECINRYDINIKAVHVEKI